MVAAAYRPGELLRIRQERWRVVRATVHDVQVALEVCGCEQSNAGTTAVFLAPAERIERVTVTRDPRVTRPARWRRRVCHDLATAVPRVESLRAAAAADITLLPFQLEPVLAVTHGLGTRLLIADEVGLGKTIQAGLIVAELLQRTADARALVVVPAALRHQWRDELAARFGLTAATLDAHGVARAGVSIAAGANPWAAFPVVVASVDYLKRPEVMRALESLIWDVLVLDEAHALSGLSDRAGAAASLAARARVVVTLSATPHSGDDEAFARLCDLGRLRDVSPLLLFRRARQDVGLRATRRTTWLRVQSTDAERDMHRALLQYARLVCRQRHARDSGARLAMSILVKRACSSAASLARSVERRRTLLDEVCDSPSDAQLPLPFAAAADDEPLNVLAVPGLEDRATERRLLDELLGLASHAALDERKITILRRLLTRCPEPAIVFTEYRDTLQHIAAHLPVSPIATVHGGLTAAERRDAIRHFTHGPAQVLLATDAASEGLNLHHRCRRVIHMEVPWTPLRLEQRVGRVDRIGQSRRVHATHLVAGASAEDDIVARLLTRMSRADTALTRPGQAEAVEAEIAAAITATPVLPLPHASFSLSDARHRIVTPDLRAAASQEAERLLVTRRLEQRTRPRSFDARPVLTRIPNRGLARCLWGLRVVFTDDRGQVIWNTLIGLSAGAGSNDSGSLRDVLALDGRLSRHPALAEHLRAAGAGSTQTAIALEREHDIATWLRARSARLVTREPGLFDRRAERASAAQRQILADALVRCERHVAHLAARQRITSGDPELAFAVLLA